MSEHRVVCRDCGALDEVYDELEKAQAQKAMHEMTEHEVVIL